MSCGMFHAKGNVEYYFFFPLWGVFFSSPFCHPLCLGIVTFLPMVVCKFDIFFDDCPPKFNPIFFAHSKQNHRSNSNPPIAFFSTPFTFPPPLPGNSMFRKPKPTPPPGLVDEKLGNMVGEKQGPGGKVFLGSKEKGFRKNCPQKP